MGLSWNKLGLLALCLALCVYFYLSSGNSGPSLTILAVNSLWLLVTPEGFLSGREDPAAVEQKPTRAERIQLNAAIWGGQLMAVSITLLMVLGRGGSMAKDTVGWCIAGLSALNLISYLVVKVMSEARWGDLPD
ncbi:hypothetical protein IT575_04380 [bacterium]|nr:hypothetical protein [bacterium]